MSILQILLFPFTILYTQITNFRNHLYNIGYSRSFDFEVFTINIGNLTVGGTGKTPHVEYLIRLLQKEYRICTLSRGYGRKTKGFLMAENTPSASEIGDEPLQFFKKFHPQVEVAVGEERALAIPCILLERPETNLILLDDAYQHRAVRPHLNLLITDYKRLFYKDFPFPSGRLRESRKGASRADAVIVSKCPIELKEEEKEDIRKNILQYTQASCPIFFSRILYGQPHPVFLNQQPIDFENDKALSVILISGIAQPAVFEKYVSEKSKVLEHFIFPDHHFYKALDFKKIIEKFDALKEDSLLLLCTEKDYVKISQEEEIRKLIGERAFYYLPIETGFDEGQADFDAFIKNKISLWQSQ